MENKYKIIVSYIQDLSVEIPNPETLITIRNTIPEYQMKVDITSKPLKRKMLEVLTTAIVGIWYARYEGFNTLRSGMSQLVKNELPLYEIVSGAAFAFAALLLILPGFATDIIGILLVFPVTRKIILS